MQSRRVGRVGNPRRSAPYDQTELADDPTIANGDAQPWDWNWPEEQLGNRDPLEPNHSAAQQNSDDEDEDEDVPLDQQPFN
eukprot:13857430-Alexandrium_andersonii.AAC.1